MSSGTTQIADVIVPEIFTPYVQQLTEQKARIIQSGVAAVNPVVNNMLAGGGLTFNIPSFQDLDDDADRVSTDTPHITTNTVSLSGNAEDLTFDPTPNKINTSQEIAVRLSRNNSWSSMDLASALAGADPAMAIADRVAYYWTRRLQAAFIASWNGVIADNTGADGADYQNNISGASFIDGVTNFSAESFIDTTVTMGDSMEDLTAVFMHSVVYARAQKNNLIDFIPDATGEIRIPTFLNREVIVDDGMPRTGSVYDTWLFGVGACQLGTGSPEVPTETDRKPGAGNGGGQSVLYNRNEWTIHPVGHAFVGTPANGGPSNASTANNLANAASWNRVYPERKQIKFARLVTREA